jgi:hypothetical protein
MFNYRNLILILMLLLVLPLVCLNVSCFGSNSIKTMNVRCNICKYAFQYSGNYEKDGPICDDRNEIPGAYLALLLPYRSSKESPNIVPGQGNALVSYQYHPGVIEFHVYGKLAVKKSVDHLESWLKKFGDGIKILDRSKITINGIEGDQIYFEGASMLINNPQWHRQIYFDYNNLNWDILAYCDKDIQSQIETDLEYIINTFKILK